jgi:hypothetical protein
VSCGRTGSGHAVQKKENPPDFTFSSPQWQGKPARKATRDMASRTSKAHSVGDLVYCDVGLILTPLSVGLDGISGVYLLDKNNETAGSPDRAELTVVTGKIAVRELAALGPRD